ncbi:MAG: hypothetical protein KatS3mg113_0600 [Planctomycetaceae bacterium]|nr:MAG: hypothetical protein KatS3mg113_0600 [Planctomycetaceae bacterium]
MSLTYFVVFLLIIVATDLLIRAIALHVMLPMFEQQLQFQPRFRKMQAHTPEEHHVKTDDGRRVSVAWYRPLCEQSDRGVVVYCPELGSSHDSVLHYASALLRHGFHLLSLDFHDLEGSSPREKHPHHWPTEDQLLRAEAVLHWMRQQPELRILPWGLMGISRGASLGLIIAAREQRISAVWAEGPYSLETLSLHHVLRISRCFLPIWLMKLIPTWHIKSTIRLLRWISGWRLGVRFLETHRWVRALAPRHVMIVAGQRDTLVPPEVSRHLHHLIGSARCQFWLVPGARHNESRLIDSEKYDQILVEFFNRMNPEPAGTPASKELSPVALTTLS